MARPKHCRFVRHSPDVIYFKPQGIPLRHLQEEILTLDELESLRLADWEGLYHEEAAQLMNLSRATFGRIVQDARRKVAKALIQGKAIHIEGGHCKMINKRQFHCDDCNHDWEVPCGTGRPSACPECKSQNIYRLHEDGSRCYGHGHGHGHGQGSQNQKGRGNRCRKGQKREAAEVS